MYVSQVYLKAMQLNRVLVCFNSIKESIDKNYLSVLY